VTPCHGGVQLDKDDPSGLGDYTKREKGLFTLFHDDEPLDQSIQQSTSSRAQAEEGYGERDDTDEENGTFRESFSVLRPNFLPPTIPCMERKTPHFPSWMASY